ncbi:gelsolin-like protein 1 [Anneissia japonica]|uniref:gelsolin-like protein 1 n=1 Tax=Anneissia japonica TaxID=1529436 RepID=UPI0014254CAB|nr:gelsolin-like protein 1 [Anneissia japonica]
MTGLVKAKEYDWKDSNMALIGSDTDREVKKESAMTEEAWKGAGEKTGLQIWRIVKFEVTHWDKNQYGSFYDGDSYIILNTYQEPDNEELLYDVHFWIGKNSTQDEYGTAAYKTVELDTLLDDKPVQHREVQNYESEMFKSYFKTLNIMSGGADSGFRHVEPEKYNPRLFQVKKESRKKISVKEVQFTKKALNSEDVFILDKGLEIYQWCGKKCSYDEKFKARSYIQETLKPSRGGKSKSETVEEESIPPNHSFYEALPDEELIPCNDETDDSLPAMHRLKDVNGKLEFTLVAEGTLKREDLASDDAFIVDTTKECIVWIGKDADASESSNALAYAHEYLKKSKHPFISVTTFRQGVHRESKAFTSALN